MRHYQLVTLLSFGLLLFANCQDTKNTQFCISDSDCGENRCHQSQCVPTCSTRQAATANCTDSQRCILDFLSGNPVCVARPAWVETNDVTEPDRTTPSDTMMPPSWNEFCLHFVASCGDSTINECLSSMKLRVGQAAPNVSVIECVKRSANSTDCVQAKMCSDAAEYCTTLRLICVTEQRCEETIETSYLQSHEGKTLGASALACVNHQITIGGTCQATNICADDLFN